MIFIVVSSKRVDLVVRIPSCAEMSSTAFRVEKSADPLRRGAVVELEYASESLLAQDQPFLLRFRPGRDGALLRPWCALSS